MSNPKEPHYFSNISATPTAAHALNAVETLDDYRDLFQDAQGAKLAGESSTSYWWRGSTAERIREFSPKAKAIVILRDPVQRTFSHYLNDLRDGLETVPLDATSFLDRPGPAALRWGDPGLKLELSFYAERLESYTNTFGDDLLVLIFEEWFASVDDGLLQLASDLGIQPFDTYSEAASRANGYRVPKNPLAQRIAASATARKAARRLVSASFRARGYEMLFKPQPKPELDEASRRKLSTLFRDDVRSVEEILGRTLPWL